MLVGRFRGGLAQVNIVASVIFSGHERLARWPTPPAPASSKST